MATSVEDVLARAEQEEADKLRSIAVHKELELEFDAGNLLAVDKSSPDKPAFKLQGKESFLRALARDNAQLLINEVWKLPTERVDGVLVAKLPAPATRLPREKPVPKAKPPSRWEQFAKLKGIQKRKKTNLVWDDVHKEWRRRWGYKRANDSTKEWLIEVPETADPHEDQFAKRREAKRERVAKNELQRLRNIARASRVKLPGAGLPPTDHQQHRQSRSELTRAAQVAHVSTASVGRFQQRLPREKAPPRGQGRKRKFAPLIGDFSCERQRQLELLGGLGGGKPRIDVTKAVNKQMREEDAEAAANKRRKGGGGGRGRKGGKGGKGGKGKGKGKR